MYFLGALQMRPPGAEQVRMFEFRIPITAPAGPTRLPVSGPIGVFTNGVPLYRLCGDGAPSHEDRRLWHYDRVRNGSSSSLAANLLQDGTRHSPILGYTLAGSPIYGPWTHAADGATLHAMRSSYRLRNQVRRTQWPGGLALMPAQEGPALDQAAPLGTFCEDYEYVPGAGDLDQFNGRFVRTPEYPGGVYAHFLTATFPYLIGEPVRQPVLDSVLFRQRGNRLEYELRGTGGATVERLEWVHERPLHLLIVSEGLEEFAHVHPELTPAGTYAVEHRFPRAGRYHLYADFTAPGAVQSIDHRVIDVEAPASSPAHDAVRATLPATLQLPDRLEAGRDVTLRIAIDPTGLEPYLGAWGHFVLISEGHTAFLHAHPQGTESAQDHHATGPPPASLAFTVNFPHAARYQLWAQFQRDGRAELRTLAFDVSSGTEARPVAIPAGAIRVNISSAGFSPAQVSVPAGRDTQLAFVRDSSQSNCGSRIVIPELRIDRPLTPGGATVVDLPPLTDGAELRFACGMGMYRGAVRGRAD